MMESTNGGAMAGTGEMGMHRRRRPRGLPIRVALPGVFLLVLGLGCKGNGNNNDGNSVIPCTSISFAGAIGSPANGDVYLLASNSSCDTVDINVWVKDLSGIFTVGFELNYPSSIIEYQSFSPGPLLYRGSPPIAPQFFVTNSSPGEIVVSGTLFRPDPSVSAVGNATFMTLHFVKVASGSGAVDFNTSGAINNQIIDENGNVVAASFGPGHGGTVLVP